MRELQAELAYDRSSEAALACELRTCMDASPRQAAAFDAITTAIDAGESKLFFVDGPGEPANPFCSQPSCTMFAAVAKLQWLVLGMAWPHPSCLVVARVTPASASLFLYLLNRFLGG